MPLEHVTTLGSLLSVSQIIPNLQATERWQAIEEIVSFLVEGGHLPKKEKENISCKKKL